MQKSSTDRFAVPDHCTPSALPSPLVALKPPASAQWQLQPKHEPSKQFKMQHRVLATIKNLKLNDHDSFVQDRCDVMVKFASGDVSLAYLTKRRPFLATEVVRQGI